MPEISEEECEEIRRYVFYNSQELPDLEDLPSKWRRMGKIFKPEGHPIGKAHQDALIQYYVDCSKTKRWAWEGLHRLLEETKGNEPELLQRWARHVLRENPKPPAKSRENKSEHNRNFRMDIMLKELRYLGFKEKEARSEISKALKYSAKGSLEDNTLKSSLQRGRNMRMR